MNWSAIAAVFLALAVGLGAFGAHGLKARLDPEHLDIYKTAVLDHFLHALGLLIVSVLPKAGALSTESANSVCWLLAAGILIFSGSRERAGDLGASVSWGGDHPLWWSSVHTGLVVVGMEAREEITLGSRRIQSGRHGAAGNDRRRFSARFSGGSAASTRRH